MSNPVGRPTKFSQDVAAEILAALRRGHYMETAAALAGISKDTLYRWLKAGARFESAELTAFWIEVEKAQAEAEDLDLTVLHRAVEKGDVETAKWRLSHRNPGRWGRTQVEMSGPNGGPIEVVADLAGELRRKLADPAEVAQARAVLDEVSRDDATD